MSNTPNTEIAPTHRCKVCGALWRFWRKEETPFAQSDSWNLRSTACGPCCDTAPMGEQIEPLTVHHLEQWIAARHAVAAMQQHLLGPNGAEVH